MLKLMQHVKCSLLAYAPPGRATYITIIRTTLDAATVASPSWIPATVFYYFTDADIYRAQCAFSVWCIVVQRIASPWVW